MKILLITNDYPPRVGGIQVYLENLYRRLAARHEVTVFAPAYPGDVAFDAQQSYKIVRYPGRIYWPTPAMERTLKRLVAQTQPDVVAFGAVLPVNLLASKLGRPIVTHTHGFEVAWARLPVARAQLEKIGRASKLVTVVSEYCRRYIEQVMPPGTRVEMLKTGVDLERFHPGVDGAEVRKRYGLEAKPVLVCISRLVARKGQDQIIKAMPLVRRHVPDATALLVGGGPYREALEKLAARLGVADRVVFAGEVPWTELPPHFAAGDVFVMPCRSRYGSLEVEGLGLVYLEAQACSRPAITGDSGGAPEAVIPGKTGHVVSGGDHRALAASMIALLSDPSEAARMGSEGRAFVQAHHDWDAVAARFESMLL